MAESGFKLWLQDAARRCGLDAVGVASVAEYEELQAFPDWIAAGHHGEMEYLEARTPDGDLKRASLRHAAPWARSVIVGAVNYNTDRPYSTAAYDPSHGWISRYAWTTRDYHDEVLARMRKLEEALLEQGARCELPGQEENDSDQPPVFVRCYVDTGPLLERVVARHAGMGWIGKNTCIIDQKLGSWLFLGVLLTSIDLPPDAPAPDRCGSCRRCIEACPTGALVKPYQLDARRCVSYLTIEKRGDLVGSTTDELLVGMGQNVFGCDICQDVCPWNRKAPATSDPAFQPRPNLVSPALDWLTDMTQEEFRETFRESPVKRTKRGGLRRNAAIAMGNSGDEQFVPVLERLCADEDEAVASAARWALRKLDEA